MPASATRWCGAACVTVEVTRVTGVGLPGDVDQAAVAGPAGDAAVGAVLASTDGVHEHLDLASDQGLGQLGADPLLQPR